VHNCLKELAANNTLDEKLAEYAFFPLSHIFNETQRLPARCLEAAVHCLRILVANGWRQRLSPAMGKQLIILLTLIVGGSPGKAEEKQLPKPRVSEELCIAGFDCLTAIFTALKGPTAERTIYHEIGTATVVDQTVYILLEGIVDDRSDELCISAANALQALYARVTDRVVLASIMPRTVSALAKVLRPTTQTRRSYKLLQVSLQILTELLRAVLNDRVVSESSPPELDSDKMALDESWLKATTTQIKLALANVIQVRRHQRPEVQSAILELCLMVIEECQTSLADSLPMMVETVVVLADKEDEGTNEAYQNVTHLATTYPSVLDSLKESLHTWLTSFPRIMQGNDETAKQWGLRQISTVFQVLSQVQSGSDLLTTSLASGLCDSVGAVVKQSTNALQPLASMDANINWEVLNIDGRSKSFPPIILEHQSQQQTLRDLRSMITRLKLSESGNEITRSIVNRMHTISSDSAIAPFWLAMTFLRDSTTATASFDDFISLDEVEGSISSARGGMIEELYYISLNILNELPSDGSGDWRTLALALESVALQAHQQGEAFRPELMDALYPTLQLLASQNPNLQRHAMTCLNILTSACNYTDTSSMIIENVDYLVNSVSLKLNTFDVSPYPPQVLFMMVKLCGARLIPYLDDLVDSIFGILDLYHGYPKLVETMFKTLAAVVEEGAKKPSLLTIDDGKHHSHDTRKSQYQHLSISSIAADIANRKAKRIQHDSEDQVISHPKKPWSETYEKPPPEPSIEELLNQVDSDEPLPPPKEPEDTEKPLSKTHILLLHIVKSIPSHLSSPSPYLRRSLLSILIDILPALSKNETTFLPLINDLWPTVASRIIFPSSQPTKLSTNLSNQEDPQPDHQEETFVTVTAISAIESMCKGAGDFMSTRIEADFPRWERLYRRVWGKVRQDAEAANKRRARSAPLLQDEPELRLQMAVSSSLALAPSTPGSKFFTSHHRLWRALVSLFMTVLEHVRLPFEIGDRICEVLCDWVVLFVGPEYYFLPGRVAALGGVGGEVEDAIRAMEGWNGDLTWFVFMRHRVGVGAGKCGDVKGEEFRLAEVVF
jgi:hypothetical protein